MNLMNVSALKTEMVLPKVDQLLKMGDDIRVHFELGNPDLPKDYFRVTLRRLGPFGTSFTIGIISLEQTSEGRDGLSFCIDPEGNINPNSSRIVPTLLEPHLVLAQLSLINLVTEETAFDLVLHFIKMRDDEQREEQMARIEEKISQLFPKEFESARALLERDDFRLTRADCLGHPYLAMALHQLLSEDGGSDLIMHLTMRAESHDDSVTVIAAERKLNERVKELIIEYGDDPSVDHRVTSCAPNVNITALQSVIRDNWPRDERDEDVFLQDVSRALFDDSVFDFLVSTEIEF